MTAKQSGWRGWILYSLLGLVALAGFQICLSGCVSQPQGPRTMEEFLAQPRLDP